MLQELQKRIEEFHMISPGDKVLVGVSGGADSVCLLLGLRAMQQKFDFSLEAIHVEHGIRGVESIKDAIFVENLCKRYQVPCHKETVDVPAYCKETGMGTEEAARVLRYQVFSKLALEKSAKIALAHHQEDNAETILFQMIRGSSLAGVCGMQPVRVDDNGVCYIRPLLFFHREDIEGFLSANSTEYCVDSTNAELDYSRNFLRAQVIPKMMKINIHAVEHINQTARHLSEVKDYLDIETERIWHQIVKEDEGIAVEIGALLELHPVMQRQIAYKAIVIMAKRQKDITSTHVEDLLALCKGQSGKQISLPYGLMAWKEYNWLHLAIIQTKMHEDREYEVSTEQLEALLKEDTVLEILIGDEREKVLCRVFRAEHETAEIPRKTYTKWFDYDKIKQGFCIRKRRSGDYFISDAFGHRKKLKDYFVNEKIPLSKRDKIWLFAIENEVLWILGGRISERVKVSPETKNILEITYDGGAKNE